MKKKYVSPTVEVEQFVLTQAVAACSGLVLNYLDSGCVLTSPDPRVTRQMKDFAMAGYFMECTLNAGDLDGLDGLCYHSNVNMAFVS